MTDTERLKQKIKDSGYKTRYVATCLGLTPQGLYKKLSGGSEFKASEIQGLQEVLNLSNNEMYEIFFYFE